MGLKSDEGLSFFAFPGVSSPNLFKQLYRSRMNSVELTEEEMNGVLEEAVRAFEFNIQVREEEEGRSWARLCSDVHTSNVHVCVLQVFDDLQKMLGVPESKQQRSSGSISVLERTLQIPGSISPLLRMVLGLFVALITVTMGIYAL